MANRDARKLLAALLAFAALGGAATSLSGCGASATLDPVARAADVSSQQPGVRFSLAMSFSAEGLPTSGATMSASGYVNQRERSGEMTMNIAGLGALGTGSAALGGFEHMQMVFKYPVIYANLPQLAGKLPEGKTWMRLDLRALAQQQGVQLPQLSSLGQTDPTEFLHYLRASGGDVTKVGEESINGVPTTHYRATIALARIIDSYPGGDRPAVSAALRALGPSGSLPADVWIDRSNRVRQMRVSMNVAVPAGASAGGEGGGGASPRTIGATVTLDFTSYGEVPAVDVPPASEVFDAASFVHAGPGAAGAE